LRLVTSKHGDHFCGTLEMTGGNLTAPRETSSKFNVKLFMLTSHLGLDYSFKDCCRLSVVVLRILPTAVY